MYARHKWPSLNKMELNSKRAETKKDAWILYCKKKITNLEYESLSNMIKSDDIENLILAIEIIKTKNRKKRKK